MLDTNHKRKGLVGTIVIHSVLFVLFLFVGMGYNDPPPEPGIAIVFGYDDAGKDGFNPPPKPKPVVEEIEEVEEEIVEEEVVEETPVEEPVSEPEPVEEEVE
ncbi:MAG: energy transducer TonB, partial [Ichthyobacteriaceae bacterium]|nr:energy transducer TonB [Ichthyobacteriaceae bacterium]